MTSQLPGEGSAEPYDVQAMLQKLHDGGIIDLDAPLRTVIPRIEEQLAAFRRLEAERRAQAGGAADAPGYCMVGDRSWFGHDPT